MKHPVKRFPVRGPLLSLVIVLAGSFVQPLVADTGILQVRVTGPDQELTPFRAWVTQNGKQHFHPTEPPTTTPYPKDKSFSCDGWFKMPLAAGPATLHIEKGKEWLPKDVTVEIFPDNITKRSFSLQQWIDLEAIHYYSTDLHIHFGHDNLRILEQLGTADDLDVIPSFSYWLRGTEPEWLSDWPDWNDQQRSDPRQRVTVSRNNIEIERIASRAKPGGAIGASFLFNLGSPLSVEHFNPYFPSDTDLCLLARAKSPQVVIDTDKPSWAETVVGAILGAYDTVQICHNHYHRRQTIPGGWGMIASLSADEAPLNQENELFHRTNKHYYSFLNCGIRLAVSGGSAIGVMPVPAGYNRVYAHVPPPFSLPKFWNAIRQGNSFATSGPVLSFDVGSQQPGSHIHYNSTQQDGLPVTMGVQSIEQLESLEVIHNGRIIRQISLSKLSPNPSLHYEHTFRHYPSRSGWYACRSLFESPPGHLRQAHSSPIYISVDKKPTAFKADAAYMAAWIDRLAAIANEPGRFTNNENHRETLNTYNRARDAYVAISELASKIWGD